MRHKSLTALFKPSWLHLCVPSISASLSLIPALSQSISLFRPLLLTQALSDLGVTRTEDPWAANLFLM